MDLKLDIFVNVLHLFLGKGIYRLESPLFTTALLGFSMMTEGSSTRFPLLGASFTRGSEGGTMSVLGARAGPSFGAGTPSGSHSGSAALPERAIVLLLAQSPC